MGCCNLLGNWVDHGYGVPGIREPQGVYPSSTADVEHAAVRVESRGDQLLHTQEFQLAVCRAGDEAVCLRELLGVIVLNPPVSLDLVHQSMLAIDRVFGIAPLMSAENDRFRQVRKYELVPGFARQVARHSYETCNFGAQAKRPVNVRSRRHFCPKSSTHACASQPTGRRGCPDRRTGGVTTTVTYPCSSPRPLL